MAYYRCQGRISKDENLTFGDGKTKFYAEGRCSVLTATPSRICDECCHYGKITELIPETCEIFGPTNWFMDGVKQYGAPSKEMFKKAIEAHNRLAMGGRKKSAVVAAAPALPQLTFIEIDEVVEVQEVVQCVLKPVKRKTEIYYKDMVNNYMFERKVDGTLVLVE